MGGGGGGEGKINSVLGLFSPGFIQSWVYSVLGLFSLDLLIIAYPETKISDLLQPCIYVSF